MFNAAFISSLVAALTFSLVSGAGRSWEKGRRTGAYSAPYRLCFLHKIDFGLHQAGFVGRAKAVQAKRGPRLAKEFAGLLKWLCREREAESEEESGRARLFALLRSKRYIKGRGADLCKAMQQWAENSFFPSSHMLVHFHFMRLRGGRRRANSVGESSNGDVHCAFSFHYENYVGNGQIGYGQIDVDVP